MLDTKSSAASYNDMESEINNLLAERAITKASEYRKVIKPLLEKRRRARINHCLTELKDLLLDTYKSDISEPSKLEKADILELTVRHLRDLRRQPQQHPASYHPYHHPQQRHAPTKAQEAEEYRAGFNECAHEITACLPTLPGLDASSRNRLINHLAKCLRNVNERPRSNVPTPMATTTVPTPNEMVTSSSSLTPPPSPVARCPTPIQQQQQQQQQYTPGPCKALPTGYVSLAVLMSHKMNDTVNPAQNLMMTAPPSPLPSPTSNAPMWRPW